MAESKSESKAAAKDAEPDPGEVVLEPGMEISIAGETNGATLTIDGEEFVLTAQDTVALKAAVDQAVAGLTL